jgi:hypothetical protein
VLLPGNGLVSDHARIQRSSFASSSPRLNSMPVRVRPHALHEESIEESPVELRPSDPRIEPISFSAAPYSSLETQVRSPLPNSIRARMQPAARVVELGNDRGSQNITSVPADRLRRPLNFFVGRAWGVCAKLRPCRKLAVSWVSLSRSCIASTIHLTSTPVTVNTTSRSACSTVSWQGSSRSERSAMFSSGTSCIRRSYLKTGISRSSVSPSTPFRRWSSA